MIGLVAITSFAAVSNGFGIEAVLGAFVAGLSLRRLGREGILTATSYSAIIVVALGTSAVATPLLRRALGRDLDAAATLPLVDGGKLAA